MNKEKKKIKLAEIPYRIEGEHIIIAHKKYTFRSLTILTVLSMYMSLAAIVVGFFHLFLAGNLVSILYILAGFLLLGIGMVYNKILKNARMQTGRRTWLERVLRR